MTVLWAWRQAQLDQSADEHPPKPGPHQDPPKYSLAQEEPVDGPKAGDQGFLPQLQARLRESLSRGARGGTTDSAIRQIVQHLAQQETELHTAIAVDPAKAARGFAWLLEHFDQPGAVVPALARLSPAIDALIGPRGRQLELFGQALADAARAVLGDRWTEADVATWRDGWQFATGWLRQGTQLLQGEIPFWTGTVLVHDQRRHDLAVLSIGTDLPYPFRAGQRAIVECHQVPGMWRSCWIGDPPAGDNHIEVHIQAVPGDAATGTLVRDTRAGDPIRLHRAEGDFVIERGSTAAMLIVAEDIHVTPVKALLSELAGHGDDRVVHLFWGVSTRDDLYDLESLREHAARCVHATVHAVVARGPAHPYLSGSLPQVVVDFGEWTSYDVYLSGTPLAVGVIRNMLIQQRVDERRIHAVTLEPFVTQHRASSSP